MLGMTIDWKNGNTNACGNMHCLPPQDEWGLDIFHQALGECRSVIWFGEVDQQHEFVAP
ncbi:hypothetical protein D3C80_1977420 [compost metagenome]